MSRLGWIFIIVGVLLALAAFACVGVGADYDRMCEKYRQEHKEDK